MGVIILAVLLICAIVSLINSIPLSVRTIYSYSGRMMGLTPRGDAAMTPSLKATVLKESPVEISSVLTCRASDTEVRSIVGRWQFAVLGIQNKDQQTFLDRFETRKVDGRLPEKGKAEAIVSEPVARNLGLKIGSNLLGPDTPDKYSPYEVKVVGIAHSDFWFMMGDYDYYVANHLPPIDLLLVLAKDPAEQPKLDKWAMQRFKGERARIISYLEIAEAADDMFKTLYKILDVVIGILIVVITIMMGMLINIFLSQRTQEFALCQALGYTKQQLIRRVIFENITIVIGGWILGALTSNGLLQLVDRLLMHPNAFALDTTDRSALLYTIPVPVAILAASFITLWNRFRKFDPVAIVERRLV
jgi:ABC-type lipoprotein release transport system permease subunit